MKSLVVLGVLCFAISGPAMAMPPVFVSSEEDDADARQCDVQQSALVATAEAALRYNRVEVASKQNYFADKALNIYVIGHIIAQKTVSGSFTGRCVAALDFQLKTYTKVVNPISTKIQWATIVFCDRGATLTFEHANLQDAMLKSVSRYVNECISEYEKSAERGAS